MKPFYLFILVTFLFSTRVAFAADCTVTTILKINSRGAEVECLQHRLGIIVDGSFGPLTNIAVKAFQANKGLISDGIVGPLTRSELFTAITQASYPVGCTSTIGYSPTTGAKCDVNSSPLTPESAKIDPKNVKNTNPNLANLDQFIQTVVQVSKKNGLSDEKLQLIADTLRNEVVNSDIDYNKEFYNSIAKDQLSDNLKNKRPLAILHKVAEKTLSFLGIFPSVAYADIGTPFGGALIFPLPCPLSDNWMITIQPLPPTYVSVLTYFSGTQAFQSYNIPITRFLLGSYTPSGTCIIPSPVGPVTIPTEGTISPTTGSSAL